MGPVLIVLFGLQWLAGWVLLWRLRQPSPAGRDAAAERVSIIIPARNEARNLPRLLASIAEQTVRPLEVLVVDDGSTDDTAGVARGFGATVIAPPPLPDGWRGKPWACHHGAMRATGERLLFMDADTWFEPGGLAHALAIGHQGALAIAPYHSVDETYEDLSLFFNLSMVAGTVPDGLLGQFLLVDRGDYQRTGGHESVRGHILENFRLAGNFRQAGVPVRSLLGRGVLSFRMYPDGLRSLMEGWLKGFAAGAKGTPPGRMALLVFWMNGLVLAPLMLAGGGDSALWAGACLLCALQVAWIARTLGSFGWLMMLLYPLPLLFFFGLFGWALMRPGRKVTWKGREIDAA